MINGLNRRGVKVDGCNQKHSKERKETNERRTISSSFNFYCAWIIYCEYLLPFYYRSATTTNLQTVLRTFTICSIHSYVDPYVDWLYDPDFLRWLPSRKEKEIVPFFNNYYLYLNYTVRVLNG